MYIYIYVYIEHTNNQYKHNIISNKLYIQTVNSNRMATNRWQTSPRTQKIPGQRDRTNIHDKNTITTATTTTTTTTTTNNNNNTISTTTLTRDEV